jgi:hypothetical protein
VSHFGESDSEKFKMHGSFACFTFRSARTLSPRMRLFDSSALVTSIDRPPWALPNSSFRFKMARSKERAEGSSKVLVFGSGNFGSCLADHLGDSEHQVHLWSRDAHVVQHFNKHRRNLSYLKEHQFSENITAVGPGLPSKELVNSMDVLLFAIPTQYLRHA